MALPVMSVKNNMSSMLRTQYNFSNYSNKLGIIIKRFKSIKNNYRFILIRKKYFFRTLQFFLVYHKKIYKTFENEKYAININMFLKYLILSHYLYICIDNK